MEQDRGGSGRGVEMRETQQQDQRGRKSHQGNQLQLQQNPPPQQQQQPPPPPAQPQKCPRCDSLNTKFCYYNNYSLAQPRYFCKTCRRYWTQGGTLRNVPVGGGCRKGKRLKRSSSPSSPSMDNFNSSSLSTSTTTVLPLRSGTKGIDNIPSSPMVPIPAGTGVPPPSMYYPSGGFLSSLAGFQSFSQPINIGSEFGGSNLALLQGFNLPFHTQQMHQQHQQHQQQQHHQQQQQEQQMYLQESHNLNMGISDELEEKVGQQNRPSTSHQEWSHSQGFPSPNPPEAVDYWSNNNNSTTTNTSTTSNLGVSLNSTHWTDHLSGYGGPPQPQPQPPPPPPSTTSSSSPSFL